MHWEDWVIFIGQIIFVIALIPTLKGKDKPPKLTSFTTGIVLLTFCVAQYSLKLYMSTIASFILGCLWLTIGIQKHFQNKN